MSEAAKAKQKAEKAEKKNAAKIQKESRNLDNATTTRLGQNQLQNRPLSFSKHPLMWPTFMIYQKFKSYKFYTATANQYNNIS